MKVTEMKHVREGKKKKNEGAPGSVLQWAMSVL